MERSTFELGLIAPDKRWQKLHVPQKVAAQRDCPEERSCFASTWFLYRLFIASKLMFSQMNIFHFCTILIGYPTVIHIFLACNRVTRRPCWWCVGGQYNRIFSWRIYMKIGFSSQRREMLLFLTLTHHQHGRRDVTCKPAIDTNQEIIIGQMLSFWLIFTLLFSFVSNSLL